MTFQEKTAAEWAPFQALQPLIGALHCRGPASRRFLILLRALPVHLFGIVDQPAWADGDTRSPAEFFFHDLDHARYKIREDLLALGYDCPDVSPATPAILPYALDAIRQAGPVLWQLAPERLSLARTLFTTLDDSPDRQLAHAGEWLLFEILHEKSFPLDRTILRRELQRPEHIAKLRKKLAAGFYEEASPLVFARLPEAREWLLGAL
ncbi:hypothetical protein [Paludibaculum fermentans]|uniref:hypothetical protein n=1 Tax=Paludibaculum fermentans TaxID=1473598 RepID=UPI003EB96BDB